MVVNEKGQSLFEFIIYLPILLLFFNLIVTISGSINGSINQQKATRGYFFYLAKGNPFIPSKRDLGVLGGAGLSSTSIYSFGWREKEGSGDTSYLTCYKIKPMLTEDKNENCDQAVPEPNSTYLVKVGTLFGVCTAYYQIESSGIYANIGYNDPGSCVSN